MTELIPNAPLLLKTLEHIENHPEEWLQEEWRCGTTACYAGHAGLIDGGEWAPWNGTVAMLARDDDPQDRVTVLDGTAIIHIEHRAQHALGLTERQADRLFSGSNALNDLRAEVYRLVGDRGRLADVTRDAAVNALNGLRYTVTAYADPDLPVGERFRRWDELEDAVRCLQDAEDPTTVLDVDAIGADHDPETYTNHLRGLVDEAVNKLIGRKP